LSDVTGPIDVTGRIDVTWRSSDSDALPNMVITSERKAKPHSCINRIFHSWTY